MASIKFYINKSKDKWTDEEVLYAKFTQTYAAKNYQSIKIFSEEPIKVDPKKWDVKKQQLKGTSTAILKVQQRITEERDRILNAWAELTQAHERYNNIPTLLELKEKLAGKAQPVSSQTIRTIYDLIDLYVEEKQLSYSKNTITYYKETTTHILQKFEARTKQSLKIEHLDLTFFSRFRTFCAERKLKNQTTNLYTEKILAVIRWHYENSADAIRNRINMDFLRVKKLPKAAKGERDHISEEEAMFLLNLNLEGRVANIRDIYLFMCFTGPRYGDTLNSLRKETNIREMEVNGAKMKVLRYVQRKVKGEEEVIVPINAIVSAIIERSNPGESGPLFKRVPLQTFNNALNILFATLKEFYTQVKDNEASFVKGTFAPAGLYATRAAKWLGFEEEINRHRLDKALKLIGGFLTKREEVNYVGNERVTEVYERWGKLSAHTGRHSFGSLLADKGASIKEAQKMLGHRNSKTTEHYFHIDKEKTLQKVSGMLEIPLMKVG